jgi:uncharacterized phage protein gp47/JayE
VAFIRPTVLELIDRIQGDFVSRLNLSVPILRRSMIFIVSRVIAGAAHLLHGHVDYLSKQLFPDTSDEEYLLRQAGIYGLTRVPAEYATGNVEVTGEDDAIIPAGTILIHADGAEYITDAEATIVGGVATVAVTASVAGEDGNRDVDVSLSFQSPVSGVDSVAVVGIDGLSNGSDQEEIEALRSRLEERIQNPPHGGSAADYEAWAREVAGVTRAWCYPLESGPGTVTVRFVRDGDADIIPGVDEIAAVQTYIDGLSPATAVVSVEAPVPVELDFSISVVPDNSTVRSAVELELEDLLRASGPGSTILVSRIRTAIGTATGVTDYTLISPSTDVVHASDEIAVIGDFTWL